MAKYAWKKSIFQGRIESEPRCFFIIKRQRDYKKTIQLFHYDGNPGGYSLVTYCNGIREAKRRAEEYDGRQS